MITAFEIYLIMQLDDIKSGLGAASAVSIAITFAFGFITLMEMGEPKGHKWIARTFLGGIIAFIFSGSAYMFVPSSRTAAAMIIIPAIANNETIQREANDLYLLAKEGLRDLIHDEDKRDDR